MPSLDARPGSDCACRSEKNTNWEGGWRVPAFLRWPGHIKPGSVVNGIVSHQDWLPTFLAAAGEPEIKEKLLKGHKAGGRTYKVHLDGFNMLPYITGKAKESPRQSFFYSSDDGDIMAVRLGDWKVVLMEQRAKTLQCWFEPFVKLMKAAVAQQIEGFKAFPPRQKPASFNLAAAMRTLDEAGGSGSH